MDSSHNEPHRSVSFGKVGTPPIKKGELGVVGTSTGAVPHCPQCGSAHAWRDGVRETDLGPAQRWLCRNCGYRFTDPGLEMVRGRLNRIRPFQRVEKVDSKSISSLTDRVYSRRMSSDPTRNRRASIDERSMRNSAAEKAICMSIAKNETAGMSPQTTETTDMNGSIVSFIWYMEKQGLARDTIRGRGGALRALIARRADLFDPETVKEALAREKAKLERGEKAWSPARRRNVINAYTTYLKFRGLTWEKPKCRVPDKIPFIPKEEELDAIIAGSGKKNASFQQIMLETALRPGEVDRLLWTDIDEERRLIRVSNPEKGSKSGVYKVSQKLIGMLRILPRTDMKIYRGVSPRSRRTTFERMRKRLARKLANPRLLQISFATYRHWKATMLYHQTKDIYYVKDFLRHKSIKNTEKYIYIERAIFGEGTGSDEYTAKVATTKEEIQALIETGFDLVLQKDDLAYFRKRK